VEVVVVVTVVVSLISFVSISAFSLMIANCFLTHGNLINLTSRVFAKVQNNFFAAYVKAVREQKCILICRVSSFITYTHATVFLFTFQVTPLCGWWEFSFWEMIKCR
jgi:hypothetical protein